jgi:hypothetical protein
MNSASTWPLRTVARAADVDSRSLRQWFTTDVLKLRGDDRRSAGAGHQVGLSRKRAYEAAIVQQLKIHGVSVSRAAKAAFEFTQNGNDGRAAGQLYPVGRTILVIKPDSTTVENIFSNTSFSEVIAASACVIAVDCNNIVEKIDAVLNLNIHRKH